MSQASANLGNIKVEKNGRLSLGFRSLRTIPFDVIGKQAALVKELDLSHNFISDLPNMEIFVNLESLVIDNNRLQSQMKLSPMPKLKLLWCNSNKIKHLSVFIEKLLEYAPSLKILSMMNNEACPNYFNGASMEKYEDYRLFVLSRLPQVTVLDSTPVTEEEKKKAKEVYGDLKLKSLAQQKEEMEKAKLLKKEQQRIQEEQERQAKEQQELERIKALKKQQEEEERKKRKSFLYNLLPTSFLTSATSAPPLPLPPTSAPPPTVLPPPPSVLPQPHIDDEEEDDEEESLSAVPPRPTAVPSQPAPAPIPVAAPAPAQPRRTSSANTAQVPTPFLVAQIAKQKQAVQAPPAVKLPPPPVQSSHHSDSDSEHEDDDEWK